MDQANLDPQFTFISLRSNSQAKTLQVYNKPCIIITQSIYFRMLINKHRKAVLEVKRQASSLLLQN